MFFYNIGIYALAAALRIASLFNGKIGKMVKGYKGIFDRLSDSTGSSGKVVWVHCSSLGEFEQGRPIIEAIRRSQPGYSILLTFFSPSGYEVRKDYPGADGVFYLPIDTPRNARRFLDAVRPDIAVFVKYEFWLNYLHELRKRKVRTFVVSAIFRCDSVFFRCYGGIFREGLRTFECIFVQNAASKQLLSTIDIENVTVSGDTRFDRVAEIADAAKEIPLAEKFAAGGGRVIVAGSTWPRDEELILQLADSDPDLKFIIAPHETGEERVEKLLEAASGKGVLYTRCNGSTDPGAARILIIDTIGILSSLYRYGWLGYIGGGFGVGIHNTLEAAAFGLPVAFGPNYGKFREAVELIGLGAARSVSDAGELRAWIDEMREHPDRYASARAKSLSYVRSNRGVTDTFMNHVFGDM